MRKKSLNAMSAHYDPKTNRVVVDVNSKLMLTFSPRDVRGLERAEPSQLDEIEILSSGIGIRFPKIDKEVLLPDLLKDLLGTRRWMASRLGRVGGLSRSKAKQASSSANGALGGRPRNDGHDHM
jgi:hypothetical protein